MKMKRWIIVLEPVTERSVQEAIEGGLFTKREEASVTMETEFDYPARPFKVLGITIETER
jgi:hypothetical protein